MIDESFDVKGHLARVSIVEQPCHNGAHVTSFTREVPFLCDDHAIRHTPLHSHVPRRIK